MGQLHKAQTCKIGGARACGVCVCAYTYIDGIATHITLWRKLLLTLLTASTEMVGHHLVCGDSKVQQQKHEVLTPSYSLFAFLLSPAIVR